MNFSRRQFLAAGALLLLPRDARADDATSDWMRRWQKNILAESRNRYCDRELGEEIGWLVSPFLEGFYYGYLATGDAAWVERFVDWNESWINRSVKEPDGFVGWPKANGASTEVVPDLVCDNQLGEAMALRHAVRMAVVIRDTPALAQRFAAQAKRWIDLSEQMFQKWDSRGCWRKIDVGGVWIVPQFGIDPQTGQWTPGYANRTTDGFSNPANKQNRIAQWLLAMHEATGKPVYRERAQLWWQQMKSRMRLRDNKYYVWNYWDPAGPWDFKPDGSTRHWVGVHPNGGYYWIDVDAIVDAFANHLVFTQQDIDRLIATNRDFMWNGQIAAAKFKRLDGGPPDPRWKDSPGVLWSALVPYDATLRRIFIANHNPSGWSALGQTPWFVYTDQHLAG